MGTKSLIVNIGSASKKYAIYEDLEQIAFFHFEKDADKFILTVNGLGKFDKDNISKEEYENSVEYLLDYSKEKFEIGVDDIFVLGFRVVAPGSYFLRHRELDDEYIKELNKARDFDEIHIDPVLEEIKKTRKIFEDLKFIAVSDSAFHKTKLEESKYYGISKNVQDERDYKRFGYHGLSVESVINKVNQKEGKNYKRTVVCHIGGGVSITGVLNGKSLDNTMGFSPLEGPMMATRSGDIDEVLLLDLLQVDKIKGKQSILDFLFMESGLKGFSGISGDLRVVRSEAFKGNENAKLAIRVYVYNILKKINEMISVTKGIDCLVFTGTIGYRADFIRELILDQLKWLGIQYDIDKNSSENISTDYIHLENPESKVKVIAVLTDEMGTIARNTLKLVK